MSINLFTTPLEKPMLSILIRQLLQQYEGNPAGLSRVLLLLPNRRSCLEFKQLWIQQSQQRARLMPRLLPIGDMDEEAIVALVGMGRPLLHDSLQRFYPTMPAVKRLMALSRALWQQQGQLALSSLGQKFNLEQMTRLAADVLTFMDEMAQYDVPREAILGLSPEYFAEHWQRCLMALKFALRWWPEYAAQEQQMSRTERTYTALHLLADCWQASAPNYPVIVAGSTGSHPATAKLLRIVMQLPLGQVIVPGLDVVASSLIWDAVTPTHPQFQLKELMRRCDVLREQVQLLDDDTLPTGRFDRARLLLESAMPAPLTHQWVEVSALSDGVSPSAWEGFSVTECANEWQEAHLVAVLLREVLETDGKTAALVTHDTALVRRVSGLLGRMGVTINNAMAQTLIDHPVVQFAMLVAHSAANPSSAVPFLAMLKHPVCRIIDDSAVQMQWVDMLERQVFRGIRRQQHVLDAVERYATASHVDSTAALMNLHDTLRPWFDKFGKNHSASALLSLHLKTVKSLCDTASHAEIFALLDQELQGIAQAGTIESALYPSLLKHCIGLLRWIPPQDAHPRLHVLSPIEARLIHVDRLVIGGLNEGSWPHAPSHSEWLNTPLRHAIGLPNTLAHIGQEAHDWVSLASATEVFVTRAKRVAGTDTLPSRWLERLQAMAGALPDRGQAYLQWIHSLHEVSARSYPEPPAPCPPLEARPRQMSVTKLDLLLKDPYGYYAQAILGLNPLNEIDEEADASTLGSLAHRVMERFVTAVTLDAAALSEARLLTIMQEVFAEYADRPQVSVVWSPRLKQLAGWIVNQETLRRADGRQVETEKTVQASFGGDPTLTLEARIDRLETRGCSALHVVDYKTGRAPENQDIVHGYGAQLPVTALILQAAKESIPVESLEYWLLGSGYKDPEIDSLKEVAACLERYQEGVMALIRQYLIELRPYYSIPNPERAPRRNPYAQLARIQEWYHAE